MRRLLVTGGAGFIGANFVHHWLAHHPGDPIVVLDTLTYAGNLASLDRSIHGPDAFIDTNVLGTHELLKAARQVWLEDGGAPPEARFHHVSTDEVYGSLGPDDAPFLEDSPYAPNSPYAASTAASDHLVRA